MKLKRILLPVFLSGVLVLSGCSGNGGNGKNTEIEDNENQTENVEDSNIEI